MIDINAYLQRISYDGPLTPTVETLRRLQRAHLRTVPFENLDICVGRPLSLRTEGLFQKIVTRRRGGFCYELNGLFAQLLRQLGYTVDMVGAQVVLGETVDLHDLGPSPFTDHMALIVHLDERWLADVGFGDSFTEPLLLDVSEAQVRQNGSFRLRRDDNYHLLQRLDAETDTWRAAYYFPLTPRTMNHFAEDCRVKQTAEYWNTNPRCSRATPDGRISIVNRRLIITTPAGREERALEDDMAYAAALCEYFGFEL